MSPFGGGFEPGESKSSGDKLRQLASRVPELSREFSRRYAKGLLGKELSDKEAMLVSGGSLLLLIAGLLAVVLAGSGSKQIATRSELNYIELLRIDGETNKLYIDGTAKVVGELSSLHDSIDSELFDRTDRLLQIRDLSKVESCKENSGISCADAANVITRLIAITDGTRETLRSFSAEQGTWLSVSGRRVAIDKTRLDHRLSCRPEETCIIFEGFSAIGR